MAYSRIFLLSPLNSPILKPNFYLYLVKTELNGEIFSLLSDNILLLLKFVFEAIKLFGSEYSSFSLMSSHILRKGQDIIIVRHDVVFTVN